MPPDGIPRDKVYALIIASLDHWPKCPRSLGATLLLGVGQCLRAACRWKSVLPEIHPTLVLHKVFMLRWLYLLHFPYGPWCIFFTEAAVGELSALWALPSLGWCSPALPTDHYVGVIFSIAVPSSQMTLTGVKLT